MAPDGRSLRSLATSSGRWHGDEAKESRRIEESRAKISSVDERVREKNNEEKILLIPFRTPPFFLSSST